MQSRRNPVPSIVEEIRNRGVIGTALARDRTAEDPWVPIRDDAILPALQRQPPAILWSE